MEAGDGFPEVQMNMGGHIQHTAMERFLVKVEGRHGDSSRSERREGCS